MAQLCLKNIWKEDETSWPLVAVESGRHPGPGDSLNPLPLTDVPLCGSSAGFHTDGRLVWFWSVWSYGEVFFLFFFGNHRHVNSLRLHKDTENTPGKSTTSTELRDAAAVRRALQSDMSEHNRDQDALIELTSAPRKARSHIKIQIYLDDRCDERNINSFCSFSFPIDVTRLT